MKFLVVGANLQNRGAEAMLLTTVRELQTRWPSARILAATYSRGDRDLLGNIKRAGPDGRYQEFELIPAMRGLRDVAFRLLALMGRRGQKYAADRCPHVAAMCDADAVLDISGFALSDRRPLWRSVVYALEAACCSRAKVPLVLLTQAFGPFKRFPVRVCARFALRRAALINARGELSAGYLTQLGLRREVDFHVADDMAWLFPAQGGSLQVSLPERPRLGVVPNTNLERAFQIENGRNQYVDAMASLCTFAIAVLGANVVLIGHEVLQNGNDDDTLCEAIRSAMSGVGNPAVVSGRHPASELKAAIGSCDFLVTSRFHALIAALSQGIPTLAIGWAHKYQESSLAGGAAPASVDFHEGVRVETLTEILALAWSERENVRDALVAQRERRTASASAPFDRLQGLIGGKAAHA
ncbi:polysaccharide pyruvyl transferase family protein [Flagellatimonas centrodinii]|uniref:polysaccharide pyruvyl transferase family protein n=1 Tax=Flagellatimonas centrodinii TaxID=2806210 RepID=UPI001FEDFE59|nr:polysaccharide pyruvyl transferase family protein [Flagellatimonas centrodinii]ULQ46622.1 polysaccharide pyruvyl transferase family protein [Flagellatimonas centrodinii]